MKIKHQELGVKQYVTIIQNPRTGTKFMVFETGNPKYYLFQQLDPQGFATQLQIPVLKTELKPEYRKALKHGYGNSGL